MKNINKTIDLKKLTELLDGRLLGDAHKIISSITEPNKATTDSIVFIKKNIYNLSEINCGVIITSLDIKEENKNIIYVENVDEAFAKVLTFFDDEIALQKGIHTSASIHPSVKLGKNTIIEENVVIREGSQIGDNSIIQAGVYIGHNVKIGNNVVLFPHVSIHKNTIICNNVIIKSNSTIGSRGFGYYTKDKKNYPIPQIGRVHIDDDVDIGANVTIDRATIGETYIAQNVKIDNLVHIAHNVTIGQGSFVVAQVGISGSVTIGKNVILAGQVGIADHLTIGDNVFVGAKSGIGRSIKDNQKVLGYPARSLLKQRRIEAIISDLPELYKKINKIENKVLKGDSNE